jgi:hypothetical protein
MKCGDTPNVRFTRKSQNTNERKIFQNYWKEITQLYGTYIDYFVYEYALSAHDFFYGEQPLAPFRVPPKGFPVLAEFQNDSMLLSKFGIQTDADVTFIIPIQTFYEQYGNYTEPKAGDLIRMTELGWDRPGGMDDINFSANAPLTACEDAANPLAQLCADGVVDAPAPDCQTDSTSYSGYDDPATFNNLLRGAHVYEITERRDENLTMQYNPLQGHYVWIIHAKRFDFSYQPNAPREPGSGQVSDETRYGLISSEDMNTGFPAASTYPFPEDTKVPTRHYDDNVDDDAERDWNYDNTDDDLYGGY